MVPVENPLHGGYSYYGSGGCAGGGGDVMSRVHEGCESCNTSDQANTDGFVESVSPSSDLHRRCLVETSEPAMAEEESRTTGSFNDAAASSSKDAGEERADNEGWLQLQLSIGGRPSNNGKERLSNASDDNSTKLSRQAVNLVGPERRSCGPVELDLLQPGSGGSELQRRPPVASGFQGPEIIRANSRQMQPPNYSLSLPFNFFHHHQGSAAGSSFPHSSHEVQWAFRPSFTAPAASIPPASSSLPPMPPSSSSYNLMPFVRSHLPRPPMAGLDTGGSSSHIRITNAPRRPHSGIWFMLQASQNQSREPSLPQITKSYLRIKDGKMTVRLLMKYLVNKLSLHTESEIEIRCRGQELEPCLTLQYVRDNVWIKRDSFALLPPPQESSSCSDHLMVLHYGRRSGS
ncbi:hypothetical protein SAY86_019665 [Trapa natans]|uniref:RING finger protein n=1 Tax=Trapa natans TaxID=22666 RepID=A0AAN7M144_TRANT|nr:hypothetical protein SAY86_019665 [Trapa natans]